MPKLKKEIIHLFVLKIKYPLETTVNIEEKWYSIYVSNITKIK